MHTNICFEFLGMIIWSFNDKHKYVVSK